MTEREWFFFILFNVVLNVVLQTLAWKLAKYITKKEEKKGNTENNQCSRSFTKNRFQMIQVEQIGPLQSLKKQDS